MDTNDICLLPGWVVLGAGMVGHSTGGKKRKKKTVGAWLEISFFQLVLGDLVFRKKERRKHNNLAEERQGARWVASFGHLCAYSQSTPPSPSPHYGHTQPTCFCSSTLLGL